MPRRCVAGMPCFRRSGKRLQRRDSTNAFCVSGSFTTRIAKWDSTRSVPMSFSSCCARADATAVSAVVSLAAAKTALARRSIGVVVLLIAMLAGSPSHTTSWRDDLPQARMLGSAELRWFGLKIYHAALWSAQAPFDPEQPFALEITYQRSISRARMVQTSIDEIRRLFADRYSEDQLRRWEGLMNNAF